MNKRPKIAFFDLDLTLLEVNSATLWVKSEYREGRLSHWQLLRAFYWLSLYHLGASRLEDALKAAIHTLKGQAEKEFTARVDLFYKTQVAHRIRPGALEIIHEHQNQGDLCYLMTNASAPLTALFMKALRFDGMLCNHFAVEEGLLTGEVEGELCFGEGKLVQAIKLLSEKGQDLKNCYFYTDSFSDLPLLSKVGYPRVVHPDRKLKKVAIKNGWPILSWS